MKTVFDPQPRMTLPVEGTRARFPVNNVFCVGRNYADHAIEMGGDPDREPPFFFMKPAFSVLADNADMPYPRFSAAVHHEVELVVAIGPGNDPGAKENIFANPIFGYGVGIDMTRRDLQSVAKAAGRPWEAGKAFLHAAPCSALLPASAGIDVNEGPIELAINGEIRQQGNLNQMIWKIPEIIERLSTLFTLAPGDLIFTGTPAGVGPIAPGDQLEATIKGLPLLAFTVGDAVDQGAA